MRSLIFVLLLLLSGVSRAAEQSYDIAIYGGTSGGIAAAIQSSRMGKTCVLIEPTEHLGGLTTGGLGATDIGNKQAIGGISREFYGRIWEHYSNPSHWTRQTRDEYFSSKKNRNAPDEKTMWTFEPHVATKVYDQMLAEAGDAVTIVRGQRLDLENGVVKEGTRIVRIVMESGRSFEGKMFIDATYEGDLMAKARVSYHVGREANSVYGEQLNGVQTGHAHHHQFVKNIDPFITPGDRSSGLLPGINADGPGEEFAGDKKVQAYNFRMCTTDVPENRRMWPKPENYDERWYELLLRNFEAGDHRVPWNPVWMPNRKTDTNNNFAISTDFIGMNWDYPEADHETRAKIWQAHKDWQMGLMWTLANSPRVPETVRAEFQRLGLAKDEFTESPDNWPRQLYVREARRMIGDYVMTEKNCRRIELVPDSVGMGAYQMDSHHVQRYVTAEGFVRNEGDVQVGSRPYPISYRSIRPRTDECTNLLVPVCLSASHIAFGSIRMEPVFMVMGQSAATAAAMAIDGGVTVQEVPYEQLRDRLVADEQVLDLDSSAGAQSGSISIKSLGGIVVDDQHAEGTGFDKISMAAEAFVEYGYRHDGAAADRPQHARFIPDLPKTGSYEVFLVYPPNRNRASNVPVVIRHADGETTVTVDQRKSPPIKGILLSLGTFKFDKGKSGSVTIANTGTDGYVVIDAVQWVETRKQASN